MRARSRGSVAVVLLFAAAAATGPGCGTRRQPEREDTVTAAEVLGRTDAGRSTAGGRAPVADVGPPADVAIAPPRFNPLGVGAVHACLLRADGLVLCWGDNALGMLGDGTGRARYAPVEVPGVAGAVDLHVEANGSCARTASGEVLCWGRFGAEPGGYALPRAVRGLAGCVQLATTSRQVCGLRPDGTVACLDRASDLATGEATPVAEVASAVELVANGDGLCVRRRDGTVLCRGGTGDGAPPDGWAAVPGIDDAEALWSAWGALWARRSSGAVWTWGHDVTRAVEQDDATTAVPRPAADPSGVLARATSLQARCALTRDGTVYCRRQLSDEDYTLSEEFERVDFPRPVRTLAAGGLFVCGMDEAGEVRCFGDNEYGELGRGDARDAVSRPTPVPGVDDAGELVVGEWDACARRASGKVVCWSVPRGGSPAPGARTVEGIAGAVSLHGGGQYTCAVDGRGVTRCWGRATWLPCLWESEDNCQPPRWTSPREAPGPAGIAGAVEVVGDCARLPDGRVRCARRYEGGPPLDVAGIDDAAELAGAAWLRCIRRRDGRVACLWPEVEGLGIPAPVDLPGVTDAERVAAASTHICVVHEGGTVSCSGMSEPATACRSAAGPCAALRPVEGVADAVDVAAGTGFSCVLHRDGGVSCWGSGERGVLGDGTTRDADRPARVADLTDAVELDAREDHVCARRAGGQVVCWGGILPGTARDDRPSQPVRMP
jgi:hypothetical protein